MAQSPRARSIDPGRRALLRAAGPVALGLLVPAAARGEEVVTLGLVAPTGTPAATALTRGAELGLDDANALATLFGKRLRLVRRSAADAGAASTAATELARGDGARALIGGLGAGVAEALRDAAAAEGVLFFNAAAPDDRLRGERCHSNAYHVTPSVAMYVDGLALWLAAQQKFRRWKLVGDGTPRGRDVEAAVRRAAARHGAAVVEAEGADIALLAMEAPAAAAAAGQFRAAGTPFAGFGDEVPGGLGADEAAGFWAVAWHQEHERFSGRELNNRFRRRFGEALTEPSWAAWAAVKLIGEGVVRGGAPTVAGLRAFFGSAPAFDGHKGVALTFRPWDGQLRQPLYVLGPRPRSDIGGRRGPLAILGQVPPGDALDAIGATAGDTRCREVMR